MLNLSQSSEHLTGSLALLSDTTPAELSVHVAGTVSGHEVAIGVFGGSDRLVATEGSGTLTGTITSGSLTMTLSASRVETHVMRVAVSRPPAGKVPRLIAAQGGQLWFYDWADSAFHGQDGSGNETGIITPQEANLKCEGGLAGCGTAMVCSEFGNRLRLVAVDDGAVTPRDLPTGVVSNGPVTCGGSTIWASTGTLGARKLLEMEVAGGAPSASIDVPGLPSGLAFDGTDLWALISGTTLFRFDPTNGTIRVAYQIPELMYPHLARGLAWDGAALWTLATFTMADGSQSVVAAKLEVAP